MTKLTKNKKEIKVNVLARFTSCVLFHTDYWPMLKLMKEVER
jgi:hypothetical protein